MAKFNVGFSPISNMFTSGANVLVNPTNRVPGYMGGGVARAIADRFMGHEKRWLAYERPLGHVFMDPVGDQDWMAREPKPAYVACLATKNRIQDSSDTVLIGYGLSHLRQQLCALTVSQPDLALRVAIPALGCGLGGLDWADIEPLIRSSFSNDLPWQEDNVASRMIPAKDVDILLFAPK